MFIPSHNVVHIYNFISVSKFVSFKIYEIFILDISKTVWMRKILLMRTVMMSMLLISGRELHWTWRTRELQYKTMRKYVLKNSVINRFVTDDGWSYQRKYYACCTAEICFQYFPEIMKRTLQNFLKMIYANS